MLTLLFIVCYDTVNLIQICLCALCFKTKLKKDSLFMYLVMSFRIFLCFDTGGSGTGCLACGFLAGLGLYVFEATDLKGTGSGNLSVGLPSGKC